MKIWTRLQAAACGIAVIALATAAGCGDDSTAGDPCENSDCDPAATCTAEGSGYTCACPAGYGDDNGDGTLCTETDECAEGLDDCDAVATCTNTDGGYTCACPAGYDDDNGDGTVCSDIDECADDLDDCDTVAVCANTDGGWTCTCPMDHTDVNGDGTLCEPPACTPEGDSHAISPTALDCCTDLVDVGCDDPDGSGGCMSCTGASFCTNCGDGICGDGENECRCPADCDFPNCVAEGDSRPIIPNAPPCCAGLIPIPCDAPDSTGTCPGGCAGASICSNCGDGTCGLGENHCNCPADCTP